MPGTILTGEVQVEIDGPVTLGAVLDALEAAHPALQVARRSVPRSI